MNKKVVGILVALLAVLAVVGGFFFFKGNKKMDAKSYYLNNLNEALKEIKKSEDMNTVVGSIKVKVNTSLAEYKFLDNLGVDLNYGLSYKDKIMTADATLLEGTDNVVSGKALFKGTKIYFNSADLFEKVYFVEDNEMDFSKYIDEALENSKEFMSIYGSVLEHVKASLDDKYFTDTTEGDYKVANLTLEGENLKTFVSKLLDGIKGDSALMEKLAKVSETSKDELVKELEEGKKEITADSCKASLKASTYSKNNNPEKSVVVINSCDGEDAKVEVVETAKNTYEVTLSGKAFDDQVFKANVVYNGNDKKPEFKVTTTVMGIKLDLTISSEINGSVNAMNVDNATNIEEMTEAEAEAMATKLQNNSKLMNIIQRFQNAMN